MRWVRVRHFGFFMDGRMIFLALQSVFRLNANIIPIIRLPQ